MLQPVRVVATGSYAPSQRLDNELISSILNVHLQDEKKRVTPEGILQVTGMHERRLSEPGLPLAASKLTLELARRRLVEEGAALPSPPTLESALALVRRALDLIGAEPRWFDLIAASQLVRDEITRALTLTQLAQDETDLLLRAAHAGITAAACDPAGVPRPYTSDLAVEAARRCLQGAGVAVEEVDAILVARATPDYFAPSVAALVQRKLGAREIFAVDIINGCSGWVYALKLGGDLVRTGAHKRVLVIGVEQMSVVVDYERKDESVIFGDGAGAVLLGPGAAGEGSDFVATTFGARGDEEVMNYKGGGSKFPASELAVRQGWNKFRMKGRQVFAFAVEKFAGLIKEVCQLGGVELKDVALVVPHQVNLRILQFAAMQLDFPMDKVMITLDQYSNMTAASCPFALDQAVQQGKLRRGDYVVFVAFGVGLAWGAVLIKY